MSIYFGNDTVNGLYIGPTPATKGYIGTHLFYNGENTIIDLTYEKYILNAQYNTLYNTGEKPITSAILKGSTKYRDIDTGGILDTFDETKNLELVSVQMSALTTSNEDDTKTNILTVNEEVKLRGIGEVVYDELNLLTGELTQRISEVVLDGSETWKANGSSTQRYFYYCNDYSDGKPRSTSVLSDKTIRNSDTGIIALSNMTASGKIQLGANFAIVADLKEWLSLNPLTVQYALATESVKTVDLSVVDQDGNSTELSTFNDITHVVLSSEGLIPEAELEVATKNK